MTDNFCVMPWYSSEIDLALGEESICCWLNAPMDRQHLQSQFLQRKKPPVCDRCWASEDLGNESRRMMENRFLDFKADRDIEKIAQDALEGRSKISLYQLSLGTVCNGTCVTCGPHSSTAWRQLVDRSFSIKIENKTIESNFQKFEDNVDWKNAKRINLLGGEPLLIKHSFFILQKLEQNHNTDCRISFVTNGSVSLTKQQIDIFRRFSDISVCVSIDGLDRMFEYLRYPLKWHTILHNLDRYREIFSEVVVSFTVSNLNYHARDPITTWFRSNDLRYIENFVHWPAHFGYQVTPDHALWPIFVDEINRQDRLKGIKIGDYIPYIASLMIQDSHTQSC